VRRREMLVLLTLNSALKDVHSSLLTMENSLLFVELGKTF